MEWSSFVKSWEQNREYLVFFSLSRRGLGFNEIRDLIYGEMQPLMPTRKIEHFRLDFLAPHYISRINEKKDESLKAIGSDALHLISNAISVDKENALGLLLESVGSHVVVMDDFWGSFNILESGSLSNSRDEVKKIFHACEEVIEGIIKRYLNIYYRMLLITNGRPDRSEDLAPMIDALIRHGYFRSLETISPVNIKLSHLRNVSAHRSYRVDNKGILYCVKKNYSEFNMRTSIEDLIEARSFLYKAVNSLKYPLMLKISEYSTEFSDVVQNESIEWKDQERRMESRLLDYLVVFSMWGYDLTNLLIDAEQIHITFGDVKGSSRDNFYNCAELLVHIWYITKKDRILISYKTDDGMYSHTWCSSGDNCEMRYMNFSNHQAINEYSKNLTLYFTDAHNELIKIHRKE